VKITDEQGEEIPLMIEKGEKRQIKGAYLPWGGKSKHRGYLAKGPKRAVVVGDGQPIKPDELLEVYQKRMKIEQTFREKKSFFEP
jgi:hypothetical protein